MDGSRCLSPQQWTCLVRPWPEVSHYDSSTLSLTQHSTRSHGSPSSDWWVSSSLVQANYHGNLHSLYVFDCFVELTTGPSGYLFDIVWFSSDKAVKCVTTSPVLYGALRRAVEWHNARLVIIVSDSRYINVPLLSGFYITDSLALKTLHVVVVVIP